MTTPSISYPPFSVNISNIFSSLARFFQISLQSSLTFSSENHPLSLSEVLPAKWFSSVRVHPPILPSSPQPPVPSIGLLRPDDIFSLGFVLATTICSSWRLGEPRRQSLAHQTVACSWHHLPLIEQQPQRMSTTQQPATRVHRANFGCPHLMMRRPSSFVNSSDSCFHTTPFFSILFPFQYYAPLKSIGALNHLPIEFCGRGCCSRSIPIDFLFYCIMLH